MYYKVVRDNGTQLLSAIVQGPYVEVSYAKDVITNTPMAAKKLGRGLLVFANLEQAEAFKNSMHKFSKTQLQIWECEVTNPRKPQPICAAYNLIYGFFVQVCAEWPDGTIEVDTVKLTKKVSADKPKEEFRF